MGTPSRIAALDTDGRLVSTYVHWDGDPDNVGRVLAQHYNTPRLARDICQLGYASDLCPTLEATASRAQNVHKALRYAGPVEFLAACEQSSAEYAYVFSLEDGWLYATMGRDGSWHPVPKA